jgi:hypothetical protein
VERKKRYKKKGIDNLFNRIIAGNFSNLKKEIVTQVQEAYRTPN